MTLAFYIRRLLVACVVFLASGPTILAGSANIFNESYAVQAIEEGVEQCGLIVQSAAGIPTQVFADEVIATPAGRILAIKATTWLKALNAYSVFYANPNGSNTHTIFVASSRVVYLTPHGGTVALASRPPVMPGNFRTTNLVCLGRYTVNESQFRECIKTYFVDPIVKQLCRFGG